MTVCGLWPKICAFDMSAKHYLALTGGIGGSKLALGLSKILGADELGFIVTTGDDFEHLGLHISPDIDTLVYTLAGLNNPDTGWGRRDESWQFMSALEDLGGETWFKLGDKDLALNIERSRRLGRGDSLSEVTEHLAKSLGVLHAILPMSNDPVRTRVYTEDGPMDFQQYFVRERCEPVVKSFEYSGAETASQNPDIQTWFESEQLGGVILCPSSPFISIDPILSVPLLRDALRQCTAPVISISPIVSGRALKGPLKDDHVDSFFVDGNAADALPLGLQCLHHHIRSVVIVLGRLRVGRNPTHQTAVRIQQTDPV